jgi:hypothetical protein
VSDNRRLLHARTLAACDFNRRSRLLSGFEIFSITRVVDTLLLRNLSLQLGVEVGVAWVGVLAETGCASGARERERVNDMRGGRDGGSGGVCSRRSYWMARVGGCLIGGRRVIDLRRGAVGLLGGGGVMGCGSRGDLAGGKACEGIVH